MGPHAESHPISEVKVLPDRSVTIQLEHHPQDSADVGLALGVPEEDRYADTDANGQRAGLEPDRAVGRRDVHARPGRDRGRVAQGQWRDT